MIPENSKAILSHIIRTTVIRPFRIPSCKNSKECDNANAAKKIALYYLIT
jgi:hypothetical protein